MFATTRFCYVMEVLFHIHYHYWGEENHVLYRGLCYIEVYNNYQGSSAVSDCILSAERIKFCHCY